MKIISQFTMLKQYNNKHMGLLDFNFNMTSIKIQIHLFALQLRKITIPNGIGK